jgi:GGDEF domain-containing protein
MARYLNKHFGTNGGFSSRLNASQFVTVLPYSDVTEAQQILNNFSQDLQSHIIHDTYEGPEKRKAPQGCLEISIQAGITQGQQIAEIESIIEAARSNQKEIARLRCDIRG